MKKSFKIYGYIIGILLTVLISFGILLPMLISAKDTLYVMLGGLLFVISVPFLYFLIYKLVNVVLKKEIE